MEAADTSLPYFKTPSGLYDVIIHELSNEDRGLLYGLQAYCASRRNGGRIAGCRRWSRTMWTQRLHVSGIHAACVQRLCRFLAWDGDDLLVLIYDREEERKASSHAALRTPPRSRAGAFAHARAQEENRIEKEENKLKKQYIPLF